MDIATIVKILQVGFAGFAFLMAGLSFRLLIREQHREASPRKAILGAIRSYMRYTLLLCVLVLIGRGAEGLLPLVERMLDLQSREARICRDGLDRLLHAGMKMAIDSDDVKQQVVGASAGCASILNKLAGDT